MYGKFDKYDLFRAAKVAFDLWDDALQKGKDIAFVNAGKAGYFTLKNLIIAHGLHDEYLTWEEMQP